MRASFTIVFLLSYLLGAAQADPNADLRFKYEGMDAITARVRRDNMYLASIGISTFQYQNYEVLLPLLFSISGEIGKRITYFGKNGSLSLNATPHIGVSHLFVAKIAGTLNLNLFNYAHFDSKKKAGFLLGSGYEFLFSSFNNGGIYPIGRTGILYDNFRLVYQQSLAKDSNSKYTLIFSSILDW